MCHLLVFLPRSFLSVQIWLLSLGEEIPWEASFLRLSVLRYTLWKMLKRSSIEFADSETFTVVCLIFNASTLTPTNIIYAMR